MTIRRASAPPRRSTPTTLHASAAAVASTPSVRRGLAGRPDPKVRPAAQLARQLSATQLRASRQQVWRLRALLCGAGAGDLEDLPQLRAGDDVPLSPPVVLEFRSRITASQVRDPMRMGRAFGTSLLAPGNEEPRLSTDRRP